MRRRPAMSLIELLITLLIMLLVTGTIIFAAMSAVDLFVKAEANGRLVSGVRFTLDSFSRRISPMLSVTRDIKILQYTDTDEIPVPSSIPYNTHYLFLQDNSVVHRDASGDKVLEGSECINSINFSIPAASDDDPENYLLSFQVSAVNPSYPDAKLDLSIKKGLFNKPAKSGSGDSPGIYTGNVLRFTAKDMLPLNCMINNLKLYKYGTTAVVHQVSKDTADLNPDITVSYDLMPKTDPETGSKIIDRSVVEWYISTGVSAGTNITDALPTDSNRDKYYWQLVRGNGEAIHSRDIDISGPFYVKSGGNYIEWGSYGVIRCRVTPRADTADGSRSGTGEPVWSPYVLVVAPKTGGSIGGELWTEWTDHLLNGTAGNGNFYEQVTPDKINISVSHENGERVLSINNSDNNLGSSISAAVRLDLMDAERLLMQIGSGNDEASYTTITNYSLIVDAQVIDSSGYGVLINGRGTTNNGAFKDYGQILQYDKQKRCFPIRLIADGAEYGHSPVNVSGPYGMEKEYQNPEFGLAGYYDPRYMQNDIFNVPYSKYDSDKPTFFTDRRRILYTILEYYDRNISDGKDHPRFIIRMRYLRPPTPEERTYYQNTDPWCVGKAFFLSEPIWFGSFVGDPCQNKQYTVRNYTSTFNGNKITLPSPPSGTSERSRYIVKFKYNDKNNNYKTYEAVFKAKLMDVRADLMEKWSSWSGLSGILDTIYDTEKKRYIGIRVWGTNTSQEGVKFYEINLAPGFSAKELKAIVPENGVLYELADTMTPEELKRLKDSGAIIIDKFDDSLNKVFHNNKYSDGEGNQAKSGKIGVMDLQHIMGDDCDCPLCVPLDSNK